jgi:hypothetical protein
MTPFEKIAISEDDIKPVTRIAIFAADDWWFKSADRAKSRARLNAEYFEEGFFHLLELGIVTVNHERMNEMEWFPMSRSEE